jgi:hypothetical protein
MDIAIVVSTAMGRSPREVQEAIAQEPPRAVGRRRKSARTAKKEEDILSWYVVVDEIVEDLVSLEAWPWPTVSPTTHFLSFDLSRTKRMTWDIDKVHAVVSKHRRGHKKEAAARPLRIGDVFRVSAEVVTDLDAWTSVSDHTHKKRAEAHAALQAMAAPPHHQDQAEALERLAKRSEGSFEPPAAVSTKARPAV